MSRCSTCSICYFSSKDYKSYKSFCIYSTCYTDNEECSTLGVTLFEKCLNLDLCQEFYKRKIRLLFSYLLSCTFLDFNLQILYLFHSIQIRSMSLFQNFVRNFVIEVMLLHLLVIDTEFHKLCYGFTLKLS